MHPRAAALQFSEHPARRRAANRVFRAELVSRPPQMAGFWDVVAKVAAPVGGIVGGIVGGPAGAAAGAAAGAGVSAIIKGKAKEAIAAAEQATGVDIPPAGEALAEAIIGAGGTVEDAAKEVVKRVVSADIGARAAMRTSFAGDNSGLRALMVSKKTGLPVPPKAIPTEYSTRSLNTAGAQTSAAVTPSAGLPRWAMYAGGAALVGGLVYVATRKGGRH